MSSSIGDDAWVRRLLDTEPQAAATRTYSRALRLAGGWLVLMGVFLVGFMTWGLATFGAPVEEGVPFAVAAFGLGLASVVVGIVAWRAATPGRPVAAAATFLAGAAALVVLLWPALLVVLPPNVLYGLDPYAALSAARLPWSIALLAPAILMVAVPAERWRASSDPRTAGRRTRLMGVLGCLLGIAAAALVVIGAAQPDCGQGRTCLPAAGVAFILPAGWARTAPESAELYAAVAGDEQTRFVVEDGADVLRDTGVTMSADLATLASRIASTLEEPGLFSSHTGVRYEVVTLPVGPAARITYTSATSFILTYNQTMISYWVPIDGRLLVLEYMRAYGEGTPVGPGGDPSDLDTVLDSLRAL